VIALVEMADDPFPPANPRARPFEAVLELQAPGEAPLVRWAAPAVDALRDLVHPDLSAAIVGEPQEIIPCSPAPLRYLYTMRRKAGTTHAEYLDYYLHHHARFGPRTPGIVGYTQFHCDPAVSAAAAAELGLGIHAIDSVSELHFEALDEFFTGVADGRLGAEAAADEERFVDRANSVSFCTVTHVA
jgi:EthD domain